MKKILFFAMAAMAAVSCSKDDSAQDTNIIRFNLDFQETKATATSFEANDAVSLYAVEYDGTTKMPLQISGNYLNNERLTFNGTSWSSDRDLYWSNNACDFYAYYPYQSGVKSIEAHPFAVATDQSAEGYEESDLLYAFAENCSRTDGTVNLQFQHMMSKLIVNIVKGEKFEGNIPDDIVAHVYNTNVECTVNFTTGSVEKNAFGAKRTITMKKNSNQQFEAVVVPQNLERKTPLIELTMGGIAYLLETSLSFRAGYVHTLTVTLNTSPDQEQIEISIDPSINPFN